MTQETKLTAKQIKALSAIRSSTDGFTLYPGLQKHLISSKVGASLWRAGLVDNFIPYNPVHKERWVITPAGRRVLQKVGG